MNGNFRNSLVVVFGVVASVVPTAYSADEVILSEDAQELVRAMKLSETAVLAARLGSERDANQKANNPVLLDCVKRLDPEKLVNDFAAAVETALTPAEIEQAHRFFSSPTGQRLVEIGVRNFQQSAGEKPDQPDRLRASEDINETDAFIRTSAGKKLLVDEVLSAPNIGEKARSHMRQMAAECTQRKARDNQ